MVKIKCKYCDNPATHIRTIDIDLPKFHLCDNDKCYYTLMINLNFNENNNK